MQTTARIAIVPVTSLLAAALLVYTAACGAMDIKLQGVPDDIAETLHAAIQTENGREQSEQEVIPRREANRRMDRGANQLKKALEAFGYYQARVDMTLAGKPGEWKAVYRVTPGEPATYRSVTLKVTGAAEKEQDLRHYISSDPLVPGAPVRHDRYESVKSELLKRTVALGYLDATLSTHRVEIDPETYRADATLIVDSGPLFRFGAVRLHQDVLRDELVHDFVRIQRGDRYSDTRLLEVEQDLRDSNYFEEVRIEPRLDEADDDGYVPVDIHLTARKRSEYQVGAGFGTDTGLRGSLSWENHRVNRRGHRLGSGLQLSEIGGALEGHYIIPFGDPRRERHRLFASYIEDKPDTNDSQLAQVGIIRSTALGRTRLDLSFTYQREDFTVAGQDGLTDLFVPGIALSRVKADDRLFTRNGLRWSASLQGSAGVVSDFAFVQPRAAGKLIHSFGDLRVILRGEAAMTAAQLEDLPASLRFFAGGDYSVRGFGYETLGPENAEGQVTGGRQLLVGSAEVDYGVSKNWRAAAFIDAGNAFDDFKNREPLRKSVGIGIRRITPIGPVRVDLAVPFRGGSGVRLHITLGPDL